MKKWAESKNIPGLFTGSTGAECLTPEQLAPADIRCHAWVKKVNLEFSISNLWTISISFLGLFDKR